MRGREIRGGSSWKPQPGIDGRDAQRHTPVRGARKPALRRENESVVERSGGLLRWSVREVDEEHDRFQRSEWPDPRMSGVVDRPRVLVRLCNHWRRGTGSPRRLRSAHRRPRSSRSRRDQPPGSSGDQSRNNGGCKRRATTASVDQRSLLATEDRAVRTSCDECPSHPCDLRVLWILPARRPFFRSSWPRRRVHSGAFTGARRGLGQCCACK